MNTKGLSGKTLRQFRAIVLTFLALTLLSGCAASGKKIGDFNETFLSGDYHASALIANAKQKNTEDIKKADLLWSLQAGTAERAAADFLSSNLSLDKSEAILKEFDEESATMDLVNFSKQLLINDAACAYRGETSDGVMINTYKGLNFMAMGDLDNARIEFNRADDRQRRAVEEFSRQIEKRQKVIAKKKEDEGFDGKAFDKTLANPELEALISEQYPAVDRWESYKDFVNPFTSYTHGLFFLVSGENQADYEKASSSFQRVAGMSSHNEFLLNDVQTAERLASGKTSVADLEPRVWVVFENGLGPIKKEQRIDIPLLFKEVHYAAIAFPKLVMRDKAYESLTITSDGAALSQTQFLASMDGVIYAEFMADLPWLITRNVLSALAKTSMQGAATKKFGGAGALLSIAYQALSTKADTRIWSTLPKEFQIASFPRPENSQLEIVDTATGNLLANIELPSSKFSIVYVKATSNTTQITGHVLTTEKSALVAESNK